VAEEGAQRAETTQGAVEETSSLVGQVHDHVDTVPSGDVASTLVLTGMVAYEGFKRAMKRWATR
jgi:hypothetical protein